jgi:hypothetical protein
MTSLSIVLACIAVNLFLVRHATTGSKPFWYQIWQFVCLGANVGLFLGAVFREFS